MEQYFKEVLKANVRDYEGKFASIIKRAPALYNLATGLLRDPGIDKATRLKLLGAIGYFVVPDDIYPEEEHGAIGYVEDIMLLQYIFRDVNTTFGKKVLLRSWEGSEEELIQVLGEEYNRLKTEYSDLHTDVLEFTGVN